MKARMYDRVELLVDMPGETQSWPIPKGTTGAVVEVFTDPTEGYAVDVNLPDASSSTGFRYDNVMLEPDQFVVVPADPA